MFERQTPYLFTLKVNFYLLSHLIKKGEKHLASSKSKWSKPLNLGVSNCLTKPRAKTTENKGTKQQHL